MQAMLAGRLCTLTTQVRSDPQKHLPICQAHAKRGYAVRTILWSKAKILSPCPRFSDGYAGLAWLAA